ncbi:MAG: peptidoglycan-binding protein [Candidatus Pacebacteria bacterium]|nr:peptidoglycan-binding protein [Candidatus Paceibacterota bacterium]
MNISKYYSSVSVIKISIITASMCMAMFAQRADALTNLISNPGFETGDTTSWTVTGNCPANAVIYGNDDYNSCVRINGGGHSGEYHVTTSYDWGTLSQEIDLLDNDFSTTTLDAEPDITASVWVISGSGIYDFKVILRDENHNDVATYDSGQQNTTGEWQKISHTFTEYGAGIRYVYFEIKGMDTLFWSGHFGASIDDASLTIGREEVSLGGCSTITNIVGYYVEINKCGVITSYYTGPTIATSTLTTNTESGTPVSLVVSTEVSTTTSTQINTTTNTTASTTTYSSIGLTSITPITDIFSTTTGSTSIYFFTKDLRVGDDNNDVKELQKYLNIAHFPISVIGAGSLGKETTYFGQKTKNALAKYQAVNGLAPARGYFGPITRGFLMGATSI